MFFQSVDMRSRKAMIDFLQNHFRYNTMNSWNNSTSYANNMKIHRLGLTSEIEDKAWELLDVEDAYSRINILVDDWGESNDYQWQAGFNGRSGGYLVLYQGGVEPSEHKSFCRFCGQRNFKTVEETGNKCGRCGEAGRINYKTPPKRIFRYYGRDTDQGEDFEDWSIEDLRSRVKLVQSFDQLCDDIVSELIDICTNYNIVEEEILVPKKIKTLQPI